MKFFILSVLLGCTTLLCAQNKTVTGVVSDEHGETIIGANIAVAGTETGVISDMNGQFSVSVSEDIRELVISYIGFATQRVSITGKTM